MARRNWVVSVSSEDNDPHIFGPYTKARAEHLAERFNARLDSEEYGSWILAGAYPIQNPGITDMLAEFGS